MAFPELRLKIEPPITIRDRIYNYIKQEILNNKIPEDVILVETRLADQMGVSRTPIREALHFLEKEGLLELLPRAGYRLRRIDWDEFEEIVQIRKVVEALAASWAITRIKPEELEALKVNVLMSETTIQQGDLSVLPELDAQFHEILARASGSKRLIDLITILRSDMLRYRLKSLHRVDTATLAIDGHRRIFQCVLERNGSGLDDAVRNHLDQCRETMHLCAFDWGESRLCTDSEEMT
jgi:DNA-binding GntR family transcriptional regulator